MKVSRILGVSMALAACSFGGWLGCSDDENVNNPDGLDASANKPDTSTTSDTGTTTDTGTSDDGSTPTDGGTEGSTSTDAGADAAPSIVISSATLSGAQEVPATLEQATGTGSVEVSADRSTVKVTLSITAVTALSTVTGAHIHIGKLGTAPAGNLAFPLATAAFTSPLTATFTAATYPDAGVAGAATFADAVNAILTGNAYFNVHTSLYGNGAIRGQIGAVSLKATLDKASEVPQLGDPPNNTTGTGAATITLNPAQDAITVSLALTGFGADAGIAAGHIHVGAAGSNGGVIFPLFTSAPANPFTKTVKAADLTAQAASNPPVTTFAQAVDAVLSAKTYVNVHTAANPNGAIRGQVVAQ